MKSQVFLGETTHRRLGAAKNGFRYRMMWLAIELDELDALDRRVAGFGVNRWSLVSWRERDYAGPGSGGVMDRLADRLAEAGVEASLHAVTLITIPRVLGFVFNPVSFYICRDATGDVEAVIAEVNNTFGETHHYAAKPHVDGSRLTFRVPKRFYVSPFLDVDGEYDVRMQVGESTFGVSISLLEQGQAVFHATMHGAGRPMSTRTLCSGVARRPLFVLSILLLIHWQAFRLLLRQTPLVLKPPAGSRTHARSMTLVERVRLHVVSRLHRMQARSTPAHERNIQ